MRHLSCFHLIYRSGIYIIMLTGQVCGIKFLKQIRLEIEFDILYRCRFYMYPKRRGSMISEKLQQARDYEKEKETAILPENRPVYHFTPLTGWMNDPNGFSWYQDRYHLFYQYFPYVTEWGPMHWGHAVSEDLLNWDYLPAALAPDQPYDEEGCWSGSAVEISDGAAGSRQLLIYTGREPFFNEERREIRQVQCLAAGDGRDYSKWDNNPVITSADLPEGASIYDFRDPKVWKDEEEACYYMAVGSRAADGHGQVLLYRSRNGFQWDYLKVLDASRGEIGSMWECPDFFELEGSAFLLLSPQDMVQEGEFQNRHGNVYIKGIYDKEKHDFIRQEVHALDFGYDFYAAQTMQAPDGRRILIAWMQAWENARTREYVNGWAGMMTVPRELSVKDGYLVQTPVRELLQRRRNPVILRRVPVSGRIRLEGVQGRCLDMTVSVSPGWKSDYDSFEIRFAEGEIKGQYYAVILRYDKKEGLITLDRSVSGYRDDALPVRRLKVDSTGQVKFRLLLDRYSAEIFVNDGRYTLTSVLETDQAAEGISFISEGDAEISVEKYEIADDGSAKREAVC